MKTKNKKIIFIVILIILILVLSFFFLNNEKQIQETNAEVVSNKKIGWGIKRNNNHEQPDVGSQNKELL